MFTLSGVWATIVSFLTTAGLKILLGLVILIVGLAIVKPLTRKIVSGKWFNKMDKTLQSFVRSGIYILNYFVVIFLAVTVMGVSAASIAALIASCGLAIGLALQGGLSNLAGGLMLLIFRPFKVGDYISAAGKEGTVEEIGIFYTTLITVDNLVVVIPNGSVTSSVVTNYTKTGLRRFDLEFGFTYGTDVNKALELLNILAQNEPMVLKDPAPTAFFASYADTTARFVLRGWVEAGNYVACTAALNNASRRLFVEQGVEVPVPKLTVYMGK